MKIATRSVDRLHPSSTRIGLLRGCGCNLWMQCAHKLRFIKKERLFLWLWFGLGLLLLLRLRRIDRMAWAERIALHPHLVAARSATVDHLGRQADSTDICCRAGAALATRRIVGIHGVPSMPY